MTLRPHRARPIPVRRSSATVRSDDEKTPLVGYGVCVRANLPLR
ncbi:MAG: hypothetical protein QOI08_4269 [Actinomycetota bacterium]|nr:hypothetical protein [Actinomycetota bacterium]